ncbi:MAG TPA: DUF362 domain-containing protein [Candidatus Cloacimonadota bacterium]|nr:DUF362 domain-containing protein [Candidatus Cloacimonadota bacterium]
MNTHTSSKVYIKAIEQYDIKQILNYFRETLALEPFKSKLDKVHKILIKPNMLGAHHPDKAVTTHPAVLEAMILFLKEQGKGIWVGDSPGGIVSAEKVWKDTGLGEVCVRHNIPLLDFGKNGMVHKTINGTDYHFEKIVFEVDGIINLAKMKTHSLMLYTGCVKNFYGLIPGLFKSELHKRFPQPKDFSQVIIDIYSHIQDRILFNVLDGIVGMEGEGPSAGKPRAFKRLFISETAPALDYAASRMMGFQIEQLDYLNQLLQNISLNLKDIEIEEAFKNEILTDVAIKEVQFRKRFLDSLPSSIKKVFNLLFNYYPYFDNTCKKCGICVKSCPMSALSLEGKAKKPTLIKSKCIKCMCCHELCPFHAVTIRKTFLARLFLKQM